MNWADAIGVVAIALAGQPFAAGGEPSSGQSLLSALTGSIPPSLQHKLRVSTPHRMP